MNISICCIVSILCYFIIGFFICKQYVDIVNEKKRQRGGMKKQVNKTKRLLKRLSVMLFYPIYALIMLGLFVVELLTEDEPFK